MTTPFPYTGSGATTSHCGTYRYNLYRLWDTARPLALFVMLNPSVADHTADDPTIRRCRSFALAAGCGGIEVVNLFAYRATHPRNLPGSDQEAIGPERDAHIVAAAHRAAASGEGSRIILAWGAQKRATRAQEEAVVSLLSSVLGPSCPLYCLGVTKAGKPRHPLFVPDCQGLERYLPLVERKKQ